MQTNAKKMEHYRRRGREVLVDFDGTLCEFNYPDLGPPRKGALEFMWWLISKGLQPVVWSSRMSLDNGNLDDVRIAKLAIAAWLIEHEFPHVEIDAGRAGKRLALAYVDDRGVAADEDNDWADVRARITEIYDREEKRWEEYDDEKV
ncbi:MAG: hypothetical protein GY906_28475 [bacterium]|nr:hypothetical protein [bacterium]